MDQSFGQSVDRFVAQRFRQLEQTRASHIETLELVPLLRENNPYLVRVKQRGLATDIVNWLLDFGSVGVQETMFDDFLRELAVFVSQEKCNGRFWELISGEPELYMDITLVRAIAAEVKTGLQPPGYALAPRGWMAAIRESHVPAVKTAVVLCP